MPDFPHMDSSQEFPHARNVNVYKFDNEFDYSRYDYDQMKITVCTVPWDMGEAHIGARTISGIGNVVYFGSKANRDAWFAAIPNNECFRFETKYKKLQSSVRERQFARALRERERASKMVLVRPRSGNVKCEYDAPAYSR